MSSDEKKYMVACIKIPLEITNNGDYNVMEKLFTVDFSFCDKESLPAENNMNEAGIQFLELMDGLLGSFGTQSKTNNNVIEPLTDAIIVNENNTSTLTNNLQQIFLIHKNEIKKKTKTNNLNMSFKKKQNTYHNLTSRKNE
jgi:hypothetical protein